MNLPIGIAALLLGGLLLWPAAGSAKVPEEDVEILDSGEMMQWTYSPTSLTVTAGTSVTWSNGGTQAHSVTSPDQLFDSRLMDNGKSWTYTFETPGTFRYFCVPHPWMKGTIVVTRAPTVIRAEEPNPRQSESASSGGSTTSSNATPTPTPTSTPSSSGSAGSSTAGGSTNPPAIP